MTTFLKFWNRIFLVFIYLFSWTLFTLFHLQDLAWIKLHFCFPIGLILAQPAVGGKHVIWPMDWNYDLNTVQEPTSTHAFIGVTNHHATDLEAKYTETNGWQLNSHNFILVWKHYILNVIRNKYWIVVNIPCWSTKTDFVCFKRNNKGLCFLVCYTGRKITLLFQILFTGPPQGSTLSDYKYNWKLCSKIHHFKFETTHL